MRDVRSLRAAVVGTGFIGVVHAEALRRLGVEITGVVGSSPERARAKAARLPLGEPYESFEAMLDDERVDVVREKPLSLDAARARELLRLAEESGLVHCTNFNVRFYPQAGQARALVAA